MIICIDGNNFLRFFQSEKTALSDAKKNQFAYELSRYQTQKPNVQEIILVFDAGPFSRATREIHHNITIMHAGQKSSADEWICEFVSRNKDKECLVITNDRALQEEITKLGATSINNQTFFGFLQAMRSSKENILSMAHDLIKYESDDLDEQHVTNNDLGTLMESASRRIINKDDQQTSAKKRHPSNNKLSKFEKKTDKFLKKL
jgi:predicted RNA-binding protein with PIN domain